MPPAAPRSAAARPAAARSGAARREARIEFHDLLSYRLQRAAYYATRPAYLVYAREFGITGVEWRLMGNLYAEAPLSLARAAEEADVHLAQASRAIAALTRRGWVRSETDSRDARALRLALTAEGRALYRRLLERARRLHETLVAGLSAEEREALHRMLDQVAAAGRELLTEQRRAASGKPKRGRAGA